MDMNGKMLAKNAERLEATAATVGVPPIENFISAPPEDIADLLGVEPVELEDSSNLPAEMRAMVEEMNLEMNAVISETQDALESVINESGGEIPPEQWFPARDGLSCVRSLLDHVRKNPSGYLRQADLIADMERVEEILERADREGVGFHFGVDY
jgi:hypothetical protein